MKISENLELGRGYFENIDYFDGYLILNGWLLLPNRQFDKFLLFVNNEFVSENEIKIREDIGEAFPFIRHAKKSAFEIKVKYPTLSHNKHNVIDICLVGIENGKQIAKMETIYAKEVLSDLPIPSSHLMKRVAGHELVSMFKSTGFQSFSDYWKQACKYKKQHEINSILDWGCGCGRMISFFNSIAEIHKIYGCDIDGEAINWCKDNIECANFDVIPSLPPTKYQSDYFDLVVSYSVFTHLERDVQISWLNEIQRITAPGGLFIASVHGEFASYFVFPDSMNEILKNGIYDDILDNHLDGIAPNNYYRATFQTKEYTHAVFSQCFEIVDYVERGCSNYQDLVIMKKTK